MTIYMMILLVAAAITLGICILIGIASVVIDIDLWWEDRKFARRVKIQRIN